MTKEKTLRNQDLVKKRQANPKKWTWGELSKFYGIHRRYAKSLFEQYVDRYGKK